MRYIIRKKKETNECDAGVDLGAASSGNYDFDAALGFGMGPVNPIGGPDKFGPIIGYPQMTKRKKYKVKKRKNG